MVVGHVLKCQAGNQDAVFVVVHRVAVAVEVLVVAVVVVVVAVTIQVIEI